ncbi:MAG: DUF2807 domain-containing protein [Cyclobacteriaceae bacterium]|nr:DUF2807 domain-containing protein [Cyclobacteriaceae bacterium]
MKTLSTLIISAMVVVSGCINDYYEKPCLRGNNNIITQTRSVELFGEIDSEIFGDLNIVITDMPNNEITITGESNIINEITTEVVNGRLKVDACHCLRFHKRLSITMNTDQLNYLRLKGAGNAWVTGLNRTDDMKVAITGTGEITMDNIETNRLHALITGEGEITTSGSVIEQQIYITGIGHYYGYDTQADITDVSITGTGSVYVATNEILDVRIDGVGTVKYKGDPQVNVRAVLTGKVIKEG